MNKTFCENCRKVNEYFIKEENLSGSLKGNIYSYKGKKAYCKKCHKVVFVHEINDYNLYKLNESYRKKNNIISLDDIKDIPKKYNIGKRPLSIVLGWGELTYSRFIEADTPTKEYSETLIKIRDDIDYFEKLLDNSKDKISKIAYEKCKKRINELKTLEATKLSATADYITDNYDVTNLVLNKLLYYIQGFYYAFYDEFIFDENCKAWQYGPVYGTQYYKYKEFKDNPINIASFENDLLNEEEINLINNVVKSFSCYGGNVLIEFTHHEQPWSMTKNNKIIKKELLGSFFKEIKKDYKINKPEDIHKYSEKMFKKYKGAYK